MHSSLVVFLDEDVVREREREEEKPETRKLNGMRMKREKGKD